MKSLLLFVKNPIAGQTKTRLAQSVGHEKALKMYQQLMDHTRAQASALKDTQRLLFYSSFIPTADSWPSPLFDKRLQAGNDLGQRMKNAFLQAFEGGSEQAIIIGSDCPGITTPLLEAAFTALDTKELVLGPALDGGYYLLGMKQLHPSLFDAIAWSTAAVADQTLAAAEALHLSTALLPALSDVDYLEDWQSYGWEVPE